MWNISRGLPVLECRFKPWLLFKYFVHCCISQVVRISRHTDNSTTRIVTDSLVHSRMTNLDAFQKRPPSMLASYHPYSKSSIEVRNQRSVAADNPTCRNELHELKPTENKRKIANLLNAVYFFFNMNTVTFAASQLELLVEGGKSKHKVSNVAL